MWYDALRDCGEDGSDLQECIRLQADTVTGSAVFQ